MLIPVSKFKSSKSMSQSHTLQRLPAYVATIEQKLWAKTLSENCLKHFYLIDDRYICAFAVYINLRGEMSVMKWNENTIHPDNIYRQNHIYPYSCVQDAQTISINLPRVFKEMRLELICLQARWLLYRIHNHHTRSVPNTHPRDYESLKLNIIRYKRTQSMEMEQDR